MWLIATGLVLAYNPIYLYYLMANGALGGMSTRAGISSFFLCFAVSYKIFILLKGKTFSFKQTTLLSLMSGFLLIFLTGLVTGVVNENSFLYYALDAFPLLEMFCIYYIIRLTPEMEINFSAVIDWVVKYILFMCLSDILIYIYLTYVEGIGFGALRANIGGTVVNRLMDFIVPLLGPGLLVLNRDSKNRVLRVFLPICIFVTVGLTFYRTAYAAFFAATGFLIIQKRKNILLFAQAIAFASIIGLCVLVVLQSRQSEHYESDMGGLVLDRIKSIFDSADDDASISARIGQTSIMLAEVPKSPVLGTGIGGTIDLGPIQYTSNYFLQILLLLGIPGAVLFIWIYAKVIRVLLWLSRTASNQNEKLFFIATASVLAGLAAILYFFPYTMYFPLLYLFGTVAGIADICYLRRKRELMANTKSV